MTWPHESSGWQPQPAEGTEPVTAPLPPTAGAAAEPPSPWARPTAWQASDASTTRAFPTYGNPYAPSHPYGGQPGGPYAGSPYGNSAYGGQPGTPYGSQPGAPTATQGWPTTTPPPGWPPAGGGWPAWPPQAPPPPQRQLPFIAVLGLILLALVVGVSGAYLFTGGPTGGLLSPDNNSAAQQPQQPNYPLPGGGSQNNGGSGSQNNGIDRDSLAAQVDPAIVDINTTLGLQNARAAGTGIVLTAAGIVLTNNHVIQGATDISAVDVGNGRTYKGTVVGYDTQEDIAVVQLAGASGLPTASVGDSSTVKVGDPILALGNAGGVGGTPAAVTGSVTSTDRSITATDEAGGSEDLIGLIEVAADIEPGDSGGPLVNAQGKVIGVDTAASSGFQMQASGGRGFAIPINQAMSIANKIIGNQPSDIIHIGPTAFIGILTNADRSSGVQGAPVAGVVSGSPAERAGIVTGDVITSVDGSTVGSDTVIGSLMIPHHPGDTIKISWINGNGRGFSTNITLAEGPPA
jgi:S1-C subfamily serine protease